MNELGLLFLWWAQALGFSLNTCMYYQIWKIGWFCQYGFRAPSHVETMLIGPIANHPLPRLSSYLTSLYNEHLLPLTHWYSSVSHFCKACGSFTSLIPPSTLSTLGHAPDKNMPRLIETSGWSSTSCFSKPSSIDLPKVQLHLHYSSAQ